MSSPIHPKMDYEHVVDQREKPGPAAIQSAQQLTLPIRPATAYALSHPVATTSTPAHPNQAKLLSKAVTELRSSSRLRRKTRLNTAAVALLESNYAIPEPNEEEEEKMDHAKASARMASRLPSPDYKTKVEERVPDQDWAKKNVMKPKDLIVSRRSHRIAKRSVGLSYRADKNTPELLKRVTRGKGAAFFSNGEVRKQPSRAAKTSRSMTDDMDTVIGDDEGLFMG